MDVLWIDQTYREALAELGLTTLSAFRERFDTRAVSRPAVEIVPRRLELPGGEPLDVFYKQYNFPRPDWRFIGRASKAECEFRNLANLRRIGVRVADRVACGAWRDRLGRLHGAFILTRTVPSALTLQAFCETHCMDRTSAAVRELRAGLGRQLAAMVRQVHDASFFHNDLYWRNILVTWQPPEAPLLWWIDCPRGHFSRLPPMQRRYAIKDLAALDRAGHRLCSPRERLGFLRDHLGPGIPPAKLKSMARKIVTYRARRWPNVTDLP